eukprot:GGOE01006699.1.p2 GENE.GGOE01006699.1~~GGOE01006699.1.p2  ORF type:complete len:206 (-),score=62.60 GGOE01006699.1:909-1472(-)
MKPRPVTPSRLEFLMEALESGALSLTQAEDQMIQLGLGEDERVQAVLAAYRDKEIEEEVDSVGSDSPLRRQPSGDSMSVCGPSVAVDEEMDYSRRELMTSVLQGCADIPEQLITSHEIFSWLESLDLVQYCGIFEEFAISPNELPNLSGQTLQGMGISNPEHRAIILRELANFHTIDEEIDVQDVEE